MSTKSAPLKEAPVGSYIKDDIPKAELAKRLKKLHEFLSTREQSAGEAKALKGISESLVSPGILGHRDRDVRLLAACCLADIIRIFAPDAPYDSDQIRAVFSLFLEQMKGVAQKDEANFTLHFFLVERLSVVKAFVLILEDSDELIGETFALAYSLVSSGDLAANIVSLLTDILQSCVDESDRLPRAALDAVLLPMTLPHRKDNAAAFALSRQLVRRSWERFREELAALYRDPGDSEVSGKLHEIIFEVNRVEPRALQTVMPALEGELRVDSDETRTRAVALLSRMFAAQGSRLHAEHEQLYSAFLSRFNDKTPDVRCTMLDFAGHFIANHGNKIASPAAPEAAAASSAEGGQSTFDVELVRRLRDPDEKVRAKAVEVVTETCRRCPEALERRTIEEAEDRMRDKKSTIRADAMRRWAAVYAALAARVARAEQDEDDVPSWWEKFLGIPSKILCCHMLGIEEDKCRVDAALAALMGGAASDDEEPSATPARQKTPTKSKKAATDAGAAARTAALLKIVSGLDGDATAALSQLVAEKRLIQGEFLRFLEARSGEGDAAAVQAAVDPLVARIPAPTAERTKEFWKRISEGKESQNLKLLATLADPESSPANATAAYLSVVAAAKAEQGGKRDRAAFLEYLATLAHRLHSSWIANDRVVAAVIGSLSAKKTGARALLSFLHSIAAAYPVLVTPALGDVTGLLDVKHLKNFSDEILRVTASECSDKLEEVDSQLARKTRKRMLPLCETGSPRQAKLAIRTISRMSSSPEGDLKSLLRKLADALDLSNENLPTILQGIGRIAEALKDGTAFEDTAPSVLAFVLDKLLRQPPVEKLAKGQPDLSLAKKYGINLLVRHLLSLKELHTIKAAPVIDMLTGLIDKSATAPASVSAKGKEKASEGEEEKEEEGDEKEEAPTKELEPQVRCAAACAIVSLAKSKFYEQMISPELIQKLGNIVRGADYGTRAALEKKLGKGLVELQLSLRFLALLSFYAAEPKKDILSLAREHVKICIQRRRACIKRRGSPTSQTNQQTYFWLLPEYALPYLVSMLAHNADLTEKEFEFARNALWMLFSALTQGSDDFLFLQQLVQFIQSTEDARHPPMTENLHTVTELALKIVRKLSVSRSWSDKGSHPGDIFLPPQYFKPLGQSKLKDLASKDTTLSDAAVSATPAKKPTAAAGSRPSSTKKRKSMTTKAEKPAAKAEDSSPEKKQKKSPKGPETPSRVMPGRGAKRAVSYEEKDDAEAEPEEAAPEPNKQKKPTEKKEDDDGDEKESSKEEVSEKGEEESKEKKKSKGKTKSKAEEDEKEEEEGEGEAEEEEEASKKRKKPSSKESPPKKKTKKDVAEKPKRRRK